MLITRSEELRIHVFDPVVKEILSLLRDQVIANNCKIEVHIVVVLDVLSS